MQITSILNEMQIFAVLLVSLIACLSPGATLSTVSGEGGNIYFSVIVSNAPATLNSSGVLSAVDRAIQLVNNDPTILPRHHLQRSLVNIQVSLTPPSPAIMPLLSWLAQGPGRWHRSTYTAWIMLHACMRKWEHHILLYSSMDTLYYPSRVVYKSGGHLDYNCTVIIVGG